MIQHFASWLDWREAPRQLVQLAFPAECAMCQAPVGTRCRLCSACHADLVSQRYCCNRCASPLAEVLPNEHCIHCQQAGWRLARVVALGHYQGKLRRAVILCKKTRCENLRYALANELADRLRQRLAGLDGPPPILLPVPNHWTRIFSRAANTTLSLASHLARRTGWPVLSDAVRRIRRTRKQGLLSRAERQQNVHHAFRVTTPQPLAGRHVILVDDVLTSGATTNELAKQLTRARVAEISAAVLARATGR